MNTKENWDRKKWIYNKSSEAMLWCF